MIVKFSPRQFVEKPLFCGQVFDRAEPMVSEADLPTVRGEFAAVWKEGEAILAARDPLGVVPLYYAHIDGIWIFATTLKEITAAYPRALTPNRRYLQGLWWEFYGLLSESPFCEIHRLPAGHVLKIEGGSTTIRRYFNVPDFETVATEKGALERVRAAVDTALKRRAPGGDNIGLFLSGGYDSALIATRFQALLGGHRLFTYSLIFPEGDEAHSPDLNLLLQNRRWTARTFPFSAEDADFFDDERSLYFYSPNLNMYKFLHQRARMDGVRRVMTGLGGDDLFTHSPGLLAGLVREGKWAEWLNVMRTRPEWMSLRELVRGTIGPLVPDLMYRAVQRLRARHPGGVALSSADERTLLETIETYERERRRFDPLPHRGNIRAKFFTSGMAAFAFEQEQELAQAQGALMSYPLLDVDLILAALGAPIDAHCDLFFAKGLLRRAMGPVLPEYVTRIFSAQRYNKMVRVLMERQSNTFDGRRQWLKSRAALDQCTALNLSLDELRIVNYIYKIFHHCEGAPNEQKGTKQKALPKAATEAVWFG